MNDKDKHVQDLKSLSYQQLLSLQKECLAQIHLKRHAELIEVARFCKQVATSSGFALSELLGIAEQPKRKRGRPPKLAATALSPLIRLKEYGQ